MYVDKNSTFAPLKGSIFTYQQYRGSSWQGSGFCSRAVIYVGFAFAFILAVQL